MSDNAMMAAAPEVADSKKTIAVLEALSNVAAKLNDEVKATLDLMEKKYAGGGQSAADFAALWNARLDVWAAYFRVYIKASTLHPDGAAIVEEYSAALFAWMSLMRPNAEPTPSKDVASRDWRPPAGLAPPPPPFEWPR